MTQINFKMAEMTARRSRNTCPFWTCAERSQTRCAPCPTCL